MCNVHITIVKEYIVDYANFTTEKITLKKLFTIYQNYVTMGENGTKSKTLKLILTIVKALAL